MEQLLLEFGVKDSVFLGMFIFLLLYVLNTSKMREDKLYRFLDEMKEQFAKLAGNYESLSRDVSDIKEEVEKRGK